MKFEVTEAGVYENEQAVEIGTVLDLGDIDAVPARLVNKGRIAGAPKKEVKVEEPKAPKKEAAKPATPPKPPAK